MRKKNVEEVSGSFVWVEGLNSQAGKFEKSYKARLVVALSLAERGSATVALPPFVHSASFLKTEEPHCGRKPAFAPAATADAENPRYCSAKLSAAR